MDPAFDSVGHLASALDRARIRARALALDRAHDRSSDLTIDHAGVLASALDRLATATAVASPVCSLATVPATSPTS